MRKIEYTKFDLNLAPPKQDEMTLLEAAGRAGWELVHITPHLIAYMRRVTEPEPAPPTRRRKQPNPPK